MKSKALVLLLFFMLSNIVFASNPQGLPFINDDYPKALSQAKQRHLPMFVEVWAPW